MSKANKRQTELDGFERPSNDELDALVGAYLEAKTERVAAQEAEDAARSKLQAFMGEASDELESNDDGEPCYRYVDGEQVYIATLRTKERLSVKKAKPSEPVELHAVE